METRTENSAPEMLEKAAEKNPVSVYTLSFRQMLENRTGKEIFIKPLAAKEEKSLEKARRSGVSRFIFQRRSAIAVALILAVGILHFVFQMSFIQSEKVENYSVAEVPPVAVSQPQNVKIDQLIESPADNKIVDDREFKAKKTNSVMPEKTESTIRKRQLDLSPERPSLQRKAPVESRAERLRRAEKLLTGI